MTSDHYHSAIRPTLVELINGGGSEGEADIARERMSALDAKFGPPGPASRAPGVFVIDWDRWSDTMGARSTPVSQSVSGRFPADMFSNNNGGYGY